MTGKKHLPDIAALVLLALWPFIYYFPVTLGQQVFAEGDINWLFSPIRTELAAALAQGRLPLWSPGLEAGFPLFAEGEVAALYPINLIVYRLFPVYVANSYTMLFHIAWASIGMFLLVRLMQHRTASALIAGFCFGFSGFMAAQLSHLPHLAVASWLPWLLLFQQRYFLSSTPGQRQYLWFGLLCLTIAVQWLGGFPQFALLDLAVYGLAGLASPVLWEDATGNAQQWLARVWRGLPRATIMTAVPLLVGTGIGAVQLLPTYELIGQSIRGQELGQSFFTSFSLDPAYLGQFLYPFAQMGAPHPFNMEFWGYIGVIPFLLALAALMLRRNAVTVFFFLLATLAIALALGGNDPLYSLLYNVPIFNRFRVPARFLLLFTFFGSVLAAIGLEAVLERTRGRSERLAPLLACGTGIAALVLLAIRASYDQPIEFWMGLWQYLPFALIPAGLVLIVVARRALTAPWLAMVLVGIAIVDLTAFRAPFVQGLTSLATPTEWTAPPRTILAMDATQPLYRVLEEKHPFSTAAIRASLWTNLALLHGKQSVNSYLPSLGLFRNKKYIEDMSGAMRDLLNVRYYLVPAEIPPYAESLPPTLDDSEPKGGLALDRLSGQQPISPTNAVQLELTSYTDGTADHPDGTLVGEVVLTSQSGDLLRLPIRLGMETADWTWEGMAKSGGAQHSKPSVALPFPAFHKSIGQAFNGFKYVARYDLDQGQSGLVITNIGVNSFLPVAGLNVENIRLIDSSGKAKSLTDLLHVTKLSLAFRSHTAAMWENLDVLPRAFVAHTAQVLSDDDALARMRQPDFPPDSLVLLADAPQPQDAEGISARPANDRVAIASYLPEHIRISVENDTPGYLVLTDSYYPGWVARVDGQEATILRADYMFRAVALTAGKHTVTFDYEPASFTWGAAISLLSLVLSVLGMVILWRKAL